MRTPTKIGNIEFKKRAEIQRPGEIEGISPTNWGEPLSLSLVSLFLQFLNFRQALKLSLNIQSLDVSLSVIL